MKKSIVLLLITLLAGTILAQNNKSKIRYSNLLPMSSSILKNIKNNNFPPYVKKTAKGLMADGKFKFVIWENMSILVPTEFANAEHESEYSTFFKKVEEIRKEDGSMFCTYCSCGSKSSWSEGDNCQPVQRSDGLHCEGGCIGENQGETCSFTQVHYPPVGGGPPRSREVSF